MRSKGLFVKIQEISVAKFRDTVAAILVGLFFLGVGATGCGQLEKARHYQIDLKSRTFTPPKGIESTFRETLTDSLEREQRVHVYVQMIRQLDMIERANLEEQGIKLLSYIGSHTWHATVSDRQALGFTSDAAVKRNPILGMVRWIGEINPTDKIEPKIRVKGIGNYNRQPDGLVDVVVVFFSDVPTKDLIAVVERYGQLQQKPGILNDVIVRLAEERIKQLSQEDVVQWIEEVGPPDEDMNNGATTTAGIGALWGAPFNLNGTNVQVGQWEGGNPDDTHGDLAGRVNMIENVGISDHATHVAGIVAGDGNLSAGQGGAANQWRGVADQTDIYSYSTAVDNLEPEDHNSAINTWGIDISTNSWSSAGNDYRARSAKFDNIVYGQYGRKIPLVFSAGNNNNTSNTIRQPGGTAKNTIVVGNINSDDSTISIKSSWGPTDEGQTKPDMVAPGDETAGDAGITSCVAQDAVVLDEHTNATLPNGDGNSDGIDDYTYPYGVKNGTSMAAPLVSGTIALMLQQYRQTYFGNDTKDDAPLPSTFKAILCHTAEDLIDNPGGGADLVGPDYVYGYGIVNAEEAVEAIRNLRFREGVILSPDDKDIYTFNVDAGEGELKVTLAWDDAPGTVGVVDILKNDLDLVLVSPDGDTFFTPWELDTANPAAPAVRNSHATEALADANRDSLNVAEQVVVDNPEAGVWRIIVKADTMPEPFQRYSIIAGAQADDQLEGGVYIIQVLDRSGSMSGKVLAGSLDTKIKVLRDAADQFTQMMRPNAGNRLGLVQFNQNVVPFDPAHNADMDELTSVRADTLTETTIPSIDAGGRTSIGDGLRFALNQFPDLPADAEHDQVILLVTDGKENEPEWIEDVRDDLIAADIAVYPLGLGYGSGLNENKLTELADATGGTFRITGDELIFRKFFLEVLAGAVDWDVINDPIGEASREDTPVTVPVTITVGQIGATFTAYWEGIDDAIDFTLISPSGTEITPATDSNRVRYGKHPRYGFYQLDFPLSSSLTAQWAGEWRMKISGTDQIPAGEKVRYSVSAFGEGGSTIEASFGRFPYLTGNVIPLQVHLSRGGRNLTGAKVHAYCDWPSVGVGNLLSEGKVTHKELEKDRLVYKDDISPVDRKLRILTMRAGKDVLKRGTSKIELFDDGRHGDAKANDGIYANNFTNTKIPGSYTFRIVASEIPGGGKLKTTREKTGSIYNRVNIIPKYSTIDMKRVAQEADYWRYSVTIVPKDKHKNYLGPGHQVRMTIYHTHGRRQILLNDNIDGTYTKEVLITKEELKSRPKLRIDIDDKEFFTFKTSKLK